jgi:hypothetical protein
MYIFILMEDKHEEDRECEDEHEHEYKTYLKEKKIMSNCQILGWSNVRIDLDIISYLSRYCNKRPQAQ